jgi:hypothetical protein
VEGNGGAWYGKTLGKDLKKELVVPYRAKIGKPPKPF